MNKIYDLENWSILRIKTYLIIPHNFIHIYKKKTSLTRETPKPEHIRVMQVTWGHKGVRSVHDSFGSSFDIKMVVFFFAALRELSHNKKVENLKG
jgi:hypothetical protein